MKVASGNIRAAQSLEMGQSITTYRQEVTAPNSRPMASQCGSGAWDGAPDPVSPPSAQSLLGGAAGMRPHTSLPLRMLFPPPEMPFLHSSSGLF